MNRIKTISGLYIYVTDFLERSCLTNQVALVINLILNKTLPEFLKSDPINSYRWSS